MIISLNYDAHVWNISNLNASIAVTFTIGMALELPADIFVIWSLDYFGRRWSTAISMILSSLATMLCAILIGKYGAGLGFVSQSLKLVTRWSTMCCSHFQIYLQKKLFVFWQITQPLALPLQCSVDSAFLLHKMLELSPQLKLLQPNWGVRVQALPVQLVNLQMSLLQSLFIW